MPRYFIDLSERVASSAALAFLGVELANGANITSVSTLHAAAVAGLVAGATVVKGLLAGFVGDPKTAALLPSDSGR